jgi:hypothetical protein
MCLTNDFSHLLCVTRFSIYKVLAIISRQNKYCATKMWIYILLSGHVLQERKERIVYYLVYLLVAIYKNVCHE